MGVFKRTFIEQGGFAAFEGAGELGDGLQERGVSAAALLAPNPVPTQLWTYLVLHGGVHWAVQPLGWICSLCLGLWLHQRPPIQC